MKLNKDAMKKVLNHIIEKQTFDLDTKSMKTMFINNIIRDLSSNEDERREITCAIKRCINERLILN